MLHNRTRLTLLAMLLLALVATVVLSLRGRQQPAPAQTVDLGSVRTEAVATFAQALTSTAHAQPSKTPTLPIPSPTPETATAAATSDTAAVSPTPSCNRLKFVRDVTIPDNTQMTPAEVFVKTWQVQNIGICPWRRGFQLNLIGGDAMGGSPLTLESTVNPGAKIEVSIKMVAPPNQTGIVQGTWRMTDENGAQFGDALTVVIVVGNGTAPAPTTGATATP